MSEIASISAPRSSRLRDLRRILAFTVLRLTGLFVTVIVGVYLTILIANMGGWVDKIQRGDRIPAQVKPRRDPASDPDMGIIFVGRLTRS